VLDWDRLSLLIPRRLKDRLRRLAEDSGVSMSAIVRTIIGLYFSGYHGVPIVRRRMVVVSEESRPVFMDEEQQKRMMLWAEVQKEIKEVLREKFKKL